MRTVHFSGRFEDWRPLARKLLLADWSPESLTWQAGAAANDLFAEAHDLPESNQPSVHLAIPRELPDLLQAAACYRADDRWALLYRILWRVTRGDRSAMLAGDPDGMELHRRHKTIRRETHHLHAYLRFRERQDSEAGPRYVAWHEPAHDVLERAAPHFHHRMGSVSWAIATPGGAALCDGQTLHFLNPCPPELMALAKQTEDRGDALWRAYYASTFNPARLNEKVMRGHMPARFWKNLPEGDLIPELMSRARAGQQRLAQTAEVGEREGRQVLIARDRAQPQRAPATSLDECRACDIWRNATYAVPGEGSAEARIMLIGEQPGDQEDLTGRPFIGPAGEILERALGKAGLSREALYVTNAVKHFKWEPRTGPTGRAATRKHASPKPAEIRACHGWLRQELETIKPKVIVALGRTALASLLETHDPQRIRLSDYSGQAFRHRDAWTLVAPHPAAVLRAGDAAEVTFEALCQALQEARSLADEG